MISVYFRMGKTTGPEPIKGKQLITITTQKFRQWKIVQNRKKLSKPISKIAEKMNGEFSKGQITYGKR